MQAVKQLTLLAFWCLSLTRLLTFTEANQSLKREALSQRLSTRNNCLKGHLSCWLSTWGGRRGQAWCLLGKDKVAFYSVSERPFWCKQAQMGSLQITHTVLTAMANHQGDNFIQFINTHSASETTLRQPFYLKEKRLSLGTAKSSKAQLSPCGHSSLYTGPV